MAEVSDGVNSRLSKEMHVKPLRKGQIVIYKLIESEKDSLYITDEKNRPRKRTPGYTICGRKKIYDPYAGKNVEIENTTKEVRVKTPFGEFTKSRPEPVRFTSQRPAIIVRDDQPELYAFMERIYENEDNPFRVKGIKTRPIFRRVDPRKHAQKENDIRQFKRDALNFVYDANLAALKACALKVRELRPDVNIRVEYADSEASTAYELLKRELGALAETDPITVIRGSNNKELLVKVQVLDARNFMIVFFDEEKRIWFHNDAEMTKIVHAEPGRRPDEVLIEFFVKDKDGSAHYSKMVETLKKFLTPR